VTLREVTADNLGVVLALEVLEEQQNFVASNARSIAQAHFHQEAWFRAIYADEVPVGFLMLHDENLRDEVRQTSFRSGQNSPKGFYARLGFKRTGNEHDGEVEIGLGL